MLITFEGIDGSGKSTQSAKLEARLRAIGRKVLCVREPGGTEIAERIREMLLDPGLAIVPVAELLLFSAARAQLVSETIRPALERDIVVLCDRFYDSTTAYQGAGRNVADQEWIQSLNRLATGGLRPDRTFWIDIPVSESVKRTGSRLLDRMEIEESDFYERIAACYASLQAREPDRICRIDGLADVETIHAAIWTDTMEMLLKSESEES